MSVLDGLKLFEKDFRLRAKIEMLMDEWKRNCPSVDVKSQIGWAHYWLIANPKRMKKDLVRFLANWMKSEEQSNQKRQGTKIQPPARYIEQRPPDEELLSPEDFQRMKDALKK